MKQVYTGLITMLCFLCCSAYINAQNVQRAVTGKIASSRGVVSLSDRANRRLYKRLTNLFAPPRFTPPAPLPYLPPTNIPITFRIHRTNYSDVTASAFAVEINGQIFGVTAGHVIANTAQMEERRARANLATQGIDIQTVFSIPYMLVQKEDGSTLSVPITSWRLSNPKGSDVAVFEIPPQALAYIHPLKLSPKRVKPWQVVSIAGFAMNEPYWFPAQEVLFSSSYRLLLRRTSHNLNSIDGLCGSPVLLKGEVAGLYIGTREKNEHDAWWWQDLLQTVSSRKLPGLHYVAPIGNIFPLINDLTGTSNLPVIMMKVLGHPVAELHPEDQLYSVKLIRNGKMKALLHTTQLTDPEHLENFFELQEHDILRITILPHTYTAQKDNVLEYDVNVSSGQVTRRKTP